MAKILGISAFYHDSAAALVVDGDIVAAAQEERFSRIKHDHNFPTQAVEWCLEEAGLDAEQTAVAARAAFLRSGGKGTTTEARLLAVEARLPSRGPVRRRRRPFA